MSSLHHWRRVRVRAALRKDGKVAGKLKVDGSDSENEDDCDDGGVRIHEADAHVSPEALRRSCFVGFFWPFGGLIS
jgi:hypothetical protein